jgi:hypothetical protein
MLDEREGKCDKVYVLPQWLVHQDGKDENRIIPDWIKKLRYLRENIEE